MNINKHKHNEHNEHNEHKQTPVFTSPKGQKGACRRLPAPAGAGPTPPPPGEGFDLVFPGPPGLDL